MTPLNSIIYLFVEGGYLGMSMITILLTLVGTLANFRGIM